MSSVVLVVDDEPLLREVVRDFLELSGYQVIEAAGGHEALEILKTKNVDCVVSDIRMPYGNGIELAKKIHELSKDKPKVILMTGYSDVTFDQMKPFGVLGILSKPFEPQDVVDFVNRILK